MQRPYHIAVFTKNRSNPAYEAARIGADRVARRWSAMVRHYVPVRVDDVDEQTALVEAAVAQKPDAAVFVPVHETKMDAAVRRFADARIPLFTFIVPLRSTPQLFFVGSDDREVGKDVARYLFERLSKPADIAILEGISASATTHARMQGFREALAAFPGVRVAATLRGDYQRDVARERSKAALDVLRGVAGILSANDAMALGAIDALASGAPGTKLPPIVGVNAIPEAIEAIAAGRMLATASFDAMAMCALATEAAIRHLNGENVPERVTLPVSIVDASNCADWNRPFATRALPRWDAVVETGRSL